MSIQRQHQTQEQSHAPELTVITNNKSKLIRWVILSVVGLLLVGGLVLATAIGAFGLLVYGPHQTYASLNEAPWQDYNVRAMRFNSQKMFHTAETALLKKSANPDEDTALRASFLLGSLYQQTQNFPKALQSYQHLLSKTQGNWLAKTNFQYLLDDTHAGMAQIYYEQGKNKEALFHLKQIDDMEGTGQEALLTSILDVLEAPDRSDNHFELAKALRHDLKLKLARKEFEVALKLSQDPATRVKITNFLATKMPADNKDLDPYVRYYSLAGRHYEDLQSEGEGGSLQQAAAFYEEAINRDPSFEWAYQQLASVYKDLDNYEAAESYASKAVSINPRLYLSYLTLGDCALSKEDYNTAAQYFGEAQKILIQLKDDYHTPLYVNVENQLGFSYELLENLPEAIRHYQNAITVAKENMTGSSDEAYSEDLDYAQTGLKRVQSNRAAKKL